MATVYKIEITATSEWTNFTPEFLEEAIFNTLTESQGNPLVNIKVKAERL